MGIYERLFGKRDPPPQSPALARALRLESKLRKVFDKLDRDGDGRVDVEDLRQVLGELHLHHHAAAVSAASGGAGGKGDQKTELGDDDFQLLLDLADVNKDAEMSFREFVLLVQRWEDFSSADAEINLGAVARRWAIDYEEHREELIREAAAAAAAKQVSHAVSRLRCDVT